MYTLCHQSGQSKEKQQQPDDIVLNAHVPIDVHRVAY